jgi:hypothetical protein
VGKLFKPKRLIIGLTVSILVLIPFFWYSFYLGRSNPDLVDSLCSNQICACKEWDRRSVGPYKVENNTWNKGDTSNFKQCVYMTERDGGVEAGWAWNWPGIRFNVVAYPNIIYGKNPWLPSTTSSFPIRIGDINCLRADLKVSQQGSGKGNLAFDLWITNRERSQPGDITHEIMIWLAHQGFGSAGSKIDTFSLDGKQIGFVVISW